MATALAVKRVQKELKAFHDKPTLENVFVHCDEWDMLKMSFVFKGRSGTPYASGWYWGRLSFPDNYPLAPPSVQMLTPSGRFATGKDICLSISSFHPENWSPGVGFTSVLEGLISFMAEEGKTVGSLDPPPPAEERRRLADNALLWNLERHDFQKAFPDFEEIRTRSRSLAPDQEAPRTTRAADSKAAPQSTVPPEFLCTLCNRVLLDPVTISCGHSFCQQCLFSSMETSKSSCSTCGATVVGGQSVNIVIKSLVERQCTAAVAERRREASQPADTNGSAGAGGRGVSAATPPMPVLRSKEVMFPFHRLHLNVASAAELQALEYAIRSGRRIAMLAGSPACDSIGCCAEVEKATRSAQGVLSEVELVGKSRVRLVQAAELHQDGFMLSRCEELPDFGLPAEELEANAEAFTAAAIACEAVAAVDSQLRGLGPSGIRVFRLHFGATPVAPSGAGSSAALEKLSWWLARVVVSRPEQRQRWLECRDTRARLLECHAILLESGGRLVLNMPGAGSLMNVGNSGLSNMLLMVGLFLIFFMARWLGFVKG